MQIIDLYIRGGNKFTSDGYFPSSTRLVDTSTDFTNGNFSVGQIIKDISTGIEGKITAIAPSGNDTLDISGGIFSGSKTYHGRLRTTWRRCDVWKKQVSRMPVVLVRPYFLMGVGVTVY